MTFNHGKFLILNFVVMMRCLYDSIGFGRENRRRRDDDKQDVDEVMTLKVSYARIAVSSELLKLIVTQHSE